MTSKPKPPPCDNCGRPATHRYWDKFAWAYFCPDCADPDTDKLIPAPQPSKAS